MRLSVIVCTHNRSSAIIDCLASIAVSLDHAAPLEAEIVVIDNASTDNTSTVVQSWAMASAWPVQLVFEPRKGLSVARNRGLAVARGELLVFTDDDCQLDSAYVRKALVYDEGDTAPVLRGGRVELGNPEDLPLTTLTNDRRESWSRARNSARHFNLGNCLLGCNMVMHRAVPQELGKFDERLGAGTGIPAGEDTDYIFRAYLAGMTIEYVPDLVVYHYHGRKKDIEALKLIGDYSQGSGALYAKFITKDYNLCRQLYWDFKSFIKEKIFRGEMFLPRIRYSYRRKLSDEFMGFLRYLLLMFPQNVAIENQSMEKLSKELDICRPLLRGKLVYLDYPLHHNIGDLLIWKGTRQFFKRHKLLLLGQYNIDNIGPGARRAIEKADTICLHGGGNLGDIWPRHQALREEIIATYPHKHIVILPQSVHFADPQALERACAIFRAHPDLHIFVRDRRSRTILEAKSVSNVQLCPDMAHALWRRLKAPAAAITTPLYLFRDDKESAGLPPAVVAHRAEMVDWKNLLTGPMAFAYRFAVRLNRADGGKGRNRLPSFSIWRIVSDRLIQRGVDLLAPRQTIVTDRLHAGILAALLERQAVVYDNSYGKISAYFDCWMGGVPGIELRGKDAADAAAPVLRSEKCQDINATNDCYKA